MDADLVFSSNSIWRSVSGGSPVQRLQELWLGNFLTDVVCLHRGARKVGKKEKVQ